MASRALILPWRRRPSLVTVVILLALAPVGFASPESASAKIVCGDRGPGSGAELDGLPASPEAGLPYQASVVSSGRHAVKPNPILFLLQCVGRQERDNIEIPLEVSPGDAGGVRSDFTAEFPRPGRWQVGLMDLSGRFHSLGLHEVRPASSKTGPDPERGTTAAVLAIGAGALAIALAFAIRRADRLL